MWSDNPAHREFTARPPYPPTEADHYRVHNPAAVAPVPNTAPRNNVKPRPERACDLCRRRKTKCDGPSAPDNTCSNCVQNNQSCTYLEGSRPRGPPKAYVLGLEDRLERMEALIKRLRPEVDFTQYLGPPIIRDSWRLDTLQSTSALRSFGKENSNPTSLNPLDHSLEGRRKSSDVESESLVPSDGEDPPFECARRKLDPHTPMSLTDETKRADGDTDVDPGTRLYGKSADIHLVGPTVFWKCLHIKEVTPPDPQSETQPPGPAVFPKIRRLPYWGPPYKWELEWEGVHLTKPSHFRSVRDNFPSPDLGEELIDLYFAHVNVVYPIFHRPTFYDHWNKGLQYHDVWFTAVCMLVFAVASRWSTDPRVLGEPEPREPGEPPRYRKAGWHYFNATVELFAYRRSILLPATLFELQLHCLIFMYLRHYLPQGAAWAFNSIGLRKAQDVGIHRKKLYEKDPNPKDELWKRVLWTMVGFDREGSVDVGRSCALREEDVDVDPPLVVDDEYWVSDNPESSFRQPSGKPSHLEAFTLWLGLTKISAFAVRTLYAVDKSKVAPAGITTSEWRERTVAQLNSAMTQWVDSLPDHLRWSPNMGNRAFATQSATLFLGYYLNQILIYRPFIPSVKSDAAAAKNTASRVRFPFPALPICLNAARTAIRILETEKKAGLSNIPVVIRACQEAGGILITHVWRLKTRDRALTVEGKLRRDSGPLVADLVADVQKVIGILDSVGDRWPLAYSLATHFRGSLPGDGEDEVDVPLSQPSPMGNPEEDESVETTTRFNILSYPLFTFDGAPEDAYDSSGPSKSGSDSPSFNPRPWAKPDSLPVNPGHGSYSVVAPQSIPRQGAVPIYRSNPPSPPSPHYSCDPLPGEGHRPIGGDPEYVNGNRGRVHGYPGQFHERVEPHIKQEYVEDNQFVSGLPDPRRSYTAGHNQPMKPAYYW